MTQHIWEVDNDINNYASVILDAENMYKHLYFEGSPVGGQWPQMSGKYYQQNEAEKTIRPIADVASLSPGMFTCTTQCKDSEIFQQAHLEFLPIFIADTTIWAVNVLEVLDCFDEEHSELKRFKSSGRVQRIKKYVFQDSLLHQEVLLFKIPQMVRTRIYATDLFKEQIKQAGFTGLKFEKIYSFE